MTNARIQSELNAVRERGSLPGITLALVERDGSLHSFASGVDLKPDAVMPAGSIGKQFFAVTALLLAREGRVDLDQKIERLFANDEWFAHVQNAHELTLRLLLTHRGGVGDHRPTPQFAAAIEEAFARRPFDPDFEIAPATLIDMLRDQPPLFAAGQGFAYSETGYLLAGLALERACQCNYYDELERQLLRPLNLTHTRPATVRKVPGLANGHLGERLAAIGFPMESVENGTLKFNPATEWTGGGLYSNAADLARWAKALFEGRAMQGPYLEELLARDAGSYLDGNGYGLGVRVAKSPLGMSYGHAGEFPGYVSIVLYFPDLGRSIALQANTALTNSHFLEEAAIRLMQIAVTP